MVILSLSEKYKKSEIGQKIAASCTNESQGESHSAESTLIYYSYSKTITEKHASKLKEENDTYYSR